MTPLVGFSVLATLFRDTPHGDEIWSCVADAINTTVFARARDIKVGVSDTDRYSALFAGALGYRLAPVAVARNLLIIWELKLVWVNRIGRLSR